MLRLLHLADTLGSETAGWDPLSPPQQLKPLEDAVLKLLDALPAFPPSVSSADLWQMLVWQLLKLVQIPAAVAAQIEAGSHTPKEAAPTKKRASRCFAEEAQSLMVEILCHRAPASAQVPPPPSIPLRSLPPSSPALWRRKEAICTDFKVQLGRCAHPQFAGRS